MVRTRTLTIERNEKKMGVSSDYCSEVTPLQNKLIDQFESVAARRRSSFWERWAEVNFKQLNEFRVQAYALHQLIQLNQYGAEAKELRSCLSVTKVILTSLLSGLQNCI